MEFSELAARALEIRCRYAMLEQERYGREWSSEELMLGFVKDVGDLAAFVQGKEGVRAIDNVDAALAHELADCLWSLFVLADRFGIDLERAVGETMDELDAQLA